MIFPSLLTDSKEILGLKSASRMSLLRLAAVATAVKDKYGSRDKLVDALATALNRAKDSDYVNKLRTLSSAQLLDRMRSAKKRSA